MSRFKTKAKRVLQEQFDRGFAEINRLIDTFREGEFIKISTYDYDDNNHVYGAGDICRIKKLEKGDWPVQFSIKRKIKRNAMGSFDGWLYRHTVQSKLPVFEVEGIRELKQGKVVDLAHLTYFGEVSLGSTFPWDTKCYVSLPYFSFLSRDKNEMYHFREVRKANKDTVKKILEDNIEAKKREKEKKEEALRKAQEEQRKSDAISEDSLVDLLNQLRNM